MPYSAERGADSRSLASRRDVVADKEVEVVGGIGYGREESLYVLPLVCAHDWPFGLIQARNDLPEVVTRPERATIAVEYLLKGGLGDRFEAPGSLRDLVERGRTGTKSGAGFLQYTDEERERLLLERDRRYAALNELLKDLPPVDAGSAP